MIGADAENSKGVYAALAKFGAPIEGLSPKDFAEPDNFFRMGTPPVMVDIMPKISGVEFDEAWSRRVDVQIDDDLSVPFISREDLLIAKLAEHREAVLKGQGTAISWNPAVAAAKFVLHQVKGQNSIDVLAAQIAQKIVDEQQTLLEHDLIKQNETSSR